MPDQNQTPPPRLALSLDMEKYLGQVEDWNLTEEQKREFIETLWGLLVAFAELGFGISAAEQAMNACGQVRDCSAKPALAVPDAVYSEDGLIADNYTGRAGASEVSKAAS